VYGQGCPYCKNKTESLLHDWLTNKYSNVKYQPKYSWCINPKTNRFLPFDFEYNNIIIELDGPQHFRQVSNWRSPDEQQYLDKYKMKCALENNKHIIRILQEDVLTNSNSWDDKLSNYIDRLMIDDTPTILYIGIDSKYFE
jgi:very-short-patch-repair endonuclease